jgi:hypothetical protein
MTRSANCVLCNLPILDGGVRVLTLSNSGSSAGAPLAPLQMYMPEAIDAAAAERARAAANAPRVLPAQQLQQLRRLAAAVAEEGNDADVLLQATRDLRGLLNRFVNDALLAVLLPAAVHEDVPLSMVRLLERQDERILDDRGIMLHGEALWLLGDIAVAEGFGEALVEAGAVPHLLRFAACLNEDFRDQALAVLGNIAADGPGSRDRLLGIGVLAPLLVLLETDTPASLECTRRVVFVLSSLCRGMPPPPLEAVRPALPALARLVRIDEKVLTNACMALSHLSGGSNDHSAAVLEANVCDRLVELV